MRDRQWQQGLDHEIGSGEDVEKAAARSMKLRAPARDHQVEGSINEGRVRPYVVERAIARIADLDELVRAAGSDVVSKVAAAASAPNAGFVFTMVVSCTVFDGFLLAGGIANAIPTTESWCGQFATGLGVAVMCTLGAWALGVGIVALDIGRFGPLVALTTSAVAGWVAGATVGEASGDTPEATRLRAVLSAASLAAACVLEVLAAERRKTVSPAKAAERVLARLVHERDALLSYVGAYQDRALDAWQAHLGQQADHQDALVVGHFAHHQQGIRNRWVWRTVASAISKFFVIALLATIPARLHAETKAVVLDVSGSVAGTGLADQVLATTPLSYGDSIEAFALECTGLRPIYRATIRRVSEPRHKQDLARVRQELSDALSRATGDSTDQGCSPIASSLATLAADLQIRIAQGEPVTLVVASDFIENDGYNAADGQAFRDVSVVVAMPPPSGKDPSVRAQAIALARKIFASAKSLIFK
ncbi:MAG: hypothetical protein UT86_C0001G0226 [Candidatus Magasanikbacteria bacterium GW2011_GWC2_40_17]|uniref:Uncharacterized protein n=1 Tax=Candidatus Magasanikbacteria bacterium GW2011_GWA2_42_32 TaxID=1619039 RepID=A0A0G1CGB3_9BACT|nr:MAG: hypothetical protein UT86_C0001G0226 [Candidatus Magasanikbacteria bacterium GW2011_GWC2_40_17]KKS57586.1 MAG: hypothetical protein UV20_C0001G0226 [Candidatus Magasanikbacteria bacterium GW2011_GWA2_42_32]OGH85461.1 MAG: hypothetical protein A2294_03590 [Candidatus Magasanikbacteria bacterium RIFOXYB2_FULL_38_10]